MRGLGIKGLLTLSGFVLTLLTTFSALTQVARAQACNPYRSGYEKAIAQGVIKRAPLVANARHAYRHFQAALDQGDRIEAAVRAVQYLVIMSEDTSIQTADLERLDLEHVIVDHYQKPVEVAVPMLNVILPNNVFCPVI